MLGAIIGDIVGSRFEFREDDNRRKSFAFFTSDCRPTDDTFMTIAVAKALLLSKGDDEKLKAVIADCMKEVAAAHPHTDWGARFYKWLFIDKPSRPYNSFGNGSAMRISPVGWVADSEKDVVRLSKIVTEITHNHPEGIKGAEAVAMGVYLARTGADKDYIRQRLSEYYSELKDPDFTIDNIYGHYGYDDDGMWVTCQGSVPQRRRAQRGLYRRRLRHYRRNGRLYRRSLLRRAVEPRNASDRLSLRRPEKYLLRLRND